MSPLSSRVQVLPRGRPKAASTHSELPHWSEVPPRDPSGQPSDRPLPPRLSPEIVAVLRDLAAWAADIAIRLTDHCPEDVAAIERVRECALAWLSGAPCPEVELRDVLTTAAALMASIDANVEGGELPTEDERDAIGAPVDA